MGRVDGTLRRWFLLIQEPRALRLAMLGFYIAIFITGIASFAASPDKFFDATGPVIVFSIGIFWILGGVAGSIAILPGFWWLEKIGLLSIGFGLIMRGVLVGALGISIPGALLLLSELILVVVRIISIRRADLAPIAG